jgi:glycosyltransferase involved in cell wall biosynthesis
MLTVSVIIPNYNHEKFLRRRIESVLNQTYPNFEVIILDDCSVDESTTIINLYKSHPKISHIVINEENSGSPFKQWAKGIELAKGELIWIAESDDYSEPTFLIELTAVFRNHSNLVLAYCGSNLVNSQNEIIGKIEREVVTKEFSYYLNSGTMECSNYLLFSPIIPNASGVLFKKEQYYKIDKSYQKYIIAGDWQFWADICLGGQIAYLPNNLNYFRQTNTSVSRTEKKGNFEIYFLERLYVAIFLCRKLESKISMSKRIRWVHNYLFSLMLEASRKRITISSKEVKTITKGCFKICSLMPLLVVKPFFQTLLFGIRKGLKIGYSTLRLKY